MQPLISVLNVLATMGFETQYKATNQGLQSMASKKIFQSDEVKVVHFYRFEGESNPDDSAILYAIETNDGEKGTLVDGYGASSDSLVADFMQHEIAIHK